MHIELGKFYRFYNRTNNEELLFKSERNYFYFLKRYRYFTDGYLSTLAYCLMPTHFHFVVQATTNDRDALRQRIATLLSSYTKAINKSYDRHGSLFQPRSKFKEIVDEKHLCTLISYIHRNPVRSHLVASMKDWKFSSYRDLTGDRNGTLPDKERVYRYFTSADDFRKYSENYNAQMSDGKNVVRDR